MLATIKRIFQHVVYSRHIIVIYKERYLTFPESQRIFRPTKLPIVLALRYDGFKLAKRLPSAAERFCRKKAGFSES